MLIFGNRSTLWLLADPEYKYHISCCSCGLIGKWYKGQSISAQVDKRALFVNGHNATADLFGLLLKFNNIYKSRERERKSCMKLPWLTRLVQIMQSFSSSSIGGGLLRRLSRGLISRPLCVRIKCGFAYGVIRHSDQ